MLSLLFTDYEGKVRDEGSSHVRGIIEDTWIDRFVASRVVRGSYIYWGNTASITAARVLLVKQVLLFRRSIQHLQIYPSEEEKCCLQQTTKAHN